MFLSQTIEFTTNLLVGLSCLAVAWLYIDAWSVRRSRDLAITVAGFGILGVGWMWASHSQSATWHNELPGWIRLAGYVLISAGQFTITVQRQPRLAAFIPLIPVFSASLTLPLAASATALIYWRKVVHGLERHLKPLAISFGLLAVAEACLWLQSHGQDSASPTWQAITVPFGVAWTITAVSALASTASLARWVDQYLTKRLLSQLLLSMTGLAFVIGIMATISSAGLLVHEVKQSSQAHLQAAANVLNYAIETQAAKTRGDSQSLVQQPAIANAITSKNHDALLEAGLKTVAANALSDITFVDASGTVLARTTDPNHFGDAAGTGLVTTALRGQAISSLQAKAGTLSPTLSIVTASPITTGGRTVGAILASLNLNDAFVHQIKTKTGLETTVFAGTIRAATTTGSSPNQHPVGTRETNTAIIHQVIGQGQSWQGSFALLGEPYIGAYLPLKDVNGAPVGMLMVARASANIDANVSTVISLVFRMAAVGLIIFLPVIYLISRHITRQVR